MIETLEQHADAISAPSTADHAVAVPAAPYDDGAVDQVIHFLISRGETARAEAVQALVDLARRQAAEQFQATAKLAAAWSAVGTLTADPPTVLDEARRILADALGQPATAPVTPASACSGCGLPLAAHTFTRCTNVLATPVREPDHCGLCGSTACPGRTGPDSCTPAAAMVPVDEQLCSDKNGFHDGHDWRPDPCDDLIWCPGYPVPRTSGPAQ
jgi:hypothetical protein